MRNELFASILLFTSITAHAEFWTGTDLIQRLEEDQRGSANFRVGMATGYVIGVADSVAGILQCMPSGISVKQVNQVVFNYMKSHPESWNQSADQLVVAALNATWPCSKK